MIWALVVAWLIATPGSLFGDPPPAGRYLADSAVAVARAVQASGDEDRADELQAYFDDLEEQLDEDRAVLEHLRGAFWAVDKRYDATHEDYERVFTDLEQFWERSAKRAIAISVAMRRELTVDEWRRVVAARRPAAQALRAAIR